MQDSDKAIYLLREHLKKAIDDVEASLIRRRLKPTGTQRTLTGQAPVFEELQPLFALRRTMDHLLEED